MHSGGVEPHVTSPDLQESVEVPNDLSETRVIRAPGMKDEHLRIDAVGQVAPTVKPTISVLVDTGAQVSLIKKGLVPEAFLVAAENPIRLVAANNRPVQGGTREVSLELVFQGFSEDTGKPVKVVVPTKLCEADIEDDVIVSYTWLGEREFQVDPRRHGIRGWVESERVWIPGSAPAMVKTTTTVQETPPVQLRREDPEPNKMALDLFSGTGSATKVLQAHGYTVKSVDCDPKWEPTHPVNILEWDYAAEYPPGTFDLIVASPPCTEYSQALTTRPRNLEGADRLVLKALEIIEFYRPTKWWLETPAHGVLARSDLMAKYPYVDCDQCQFADYGYRKPTRFFGSNHLTELSHVRCDQRTCGWSRIPRTPPATVATRTVWEATTGS